MPNMSKAGLDAEQRRFIDDLSALLTPWGMPLSLARVYGYLLLRSLPVSLDDIAADLEMSKSSASVAARDLERNALARRHGERGSKRVFYAVSDNYAGFLLDRTRMLGNLGKLMQGRANAVTSGAAARRMKDRARAYLKLRDATEAAIEEIAAETTRGKR